MQWRGQRQRSEKWGQGVGRQSATSVLKHLFHKNTKVLANTSLQKYSTKQIFFFLHKTYEFERNFKKKKKEKRKERYALREIQRLKSNSSQFRIKISRNQLSTFQKNSLFEAEVSVMTKSIDHLYSTVPSKITSYLNSANS